ncbi:hypothetical protein ARMSODRAFT_1020414 [Armillaria solidipes]|uniref:DUF7330 domain-containing protein n=1 Tax=Armillaria solidipes TaxID=1076256 RepID=A0A2H3B922_9AGAR|nr:hypothetical protein ARMSODRAFT_1020414 [Armillaria solidipes]
MLQSSRQPCYESRCPGNYMTIVRDSDSIKESFLIDASRSVPSKLLPPRTSHETKDRRNNLNIITKKGEINADIEIVESSRTTTFRVDIRSRGDINIHLHLPGTISPNSDERPGPLCLMDVYSSSGDIYLWVPPKRLEGPLNVKARDVGFSDALSKDMNTFIEKGKRREYFIGNFTAWSEGAGDVIKLKAKAGTVYVQYTGETPSIKVSPVECITA